MNEKPLAPPHQIGINKISKLHNFPINLFWGWAQTPPASNRDTNNQQKCTSLCARVPRVWVLPLLDTLGPPPVVTWHAAPQFGQTFCYNIQIWPHFQLPQPPNLVTVCIFFIFTERLSSADQPWGSLRTWMWFSYLEDLGGGQSRHFWGASLETYSGGGQLKKHPVFR